MLRNKVTFSVLKRFNLRLLELGALMFAAAGLGSMASPIFGFSYVQSRKAFGPKLISIFATQQLIFLLLRRVRMEPIWMGGGCLPDEGRP